jgi:hypothetical protein
VTSPHYPITSKLYQLSEVVRNLRKSSAQESQMGLLQFCSGTRFVPFTYDGQYYDSVTGTLILMIVISADA